MTSTPRHHGHDDEEPPPPRVSHLLLVGLVLVLLTTATWLLAHLPHGRWSLPVALVIAVVKAGLVGAIFMELARRRGGSKVMTAVAIVLMGTLLLFAVLETTQRFPPAIPPGPFGALEEPGVTGEQSRAPDWRTP